MESDTDMHDRVTLDKAIDALNTTEQQDAGAGGKVLLEGKITTIKERAETIGLTSDQLCRVVSVITSKHFKESQLNQLIHCLIPAQTIPQRCATSLIFWITAKRPTFKSQAVVMWWIASIYPYLDSTQDLHSMYNILLRLLNSDLLREHVCQILYNLTGKPDCPLYRARILSRLRTNVGSEAGLDALLSVYRMHCPNSVPPFSASTARRRRVGKVEAAWLESVRVVQQHNHSSTPQPRIHTTHTPSKSPMSKRSRLDIVPRLTQATVPQGATTLHDYIPFVMIRSFSEYCLNAHRLQTPANIGCLLNDAILRHFVSVQHDVTINHRFSYWLQHALYEDFLNNPMAISDAQKDEFLYKISQFATFIQERIPVCDVFLETLLMQWDGQTHRRHVFSLLSHYTRTQPQRLKEAILDPLHRLYFTSPLSFKVDMVEMLTEVLRHLVTREWMRYTAHSEDTQWSVLFKDEGTTPNPLPTIVCVIRYMDDLVNRTLLQPDGHDLVLLNSFLSFYTIVSGLFVNHAVPFMHLTPSCLLYAALLSSQPYLIDQVFCIFVTHKLGTEAIMGSDKYRSLKKRNGLTSSYRAAFNRLSCDIVPLVVRMLHTRPSYGGSVISQWDNSSYRTAFNHLSCDIVPLVTRMLHTRPSYGSSVISQEFMEGRDPESINTTLTLTYHSAFTPYLHDLLPDPLPDPRSLAKVHATLREAGLRGVDAVCTSLTKPSTNNSTTIRNSQHSIV